MRVKSIDSNNIQVRSFFPANFGNAYRTSNVFLVQKISKCMSYLRTIITAWSVFNLRHSWIRHVEGTAEWLKTSSKGKGTVKKK